MLHTFVRLALVCWLSLTLAPIAAASSDAVVTDRIVEVLDQLEADGDFGSAMEALSGLFDQVVVHASTNQPETFRNVAMALRLVTQLAETDETIRMELLKYLRANPRLASSICFLIRPEHDRPDKVYALLYELAQKRSRMLDRYANLAAAICVVHEAPFSRRINENTTYPPDPLTIFDYFVKYESRMAFGISHMPAELLIYVVDVTASVDEMIWAMNRYAGNTEIGRRFFEIDYDNDHFRKGKPKRVTEKGYSLQNILRYGGVCADQAYFAMTVGKSIGVPTTYTRGRSSDVSHAWVGFLQADGRRAWWNFDAGRYEAYQGVRGEVLDPQIRQDIPDSHVSLLAGLSSTSETKRQQAAAMIDAALHLRHAAKRHDFDPPPLSADGESDKPRSTGLDDQLGLIEAGLRLAPQYAPGWFAVRDLASNGELSLKHKQYWSGALHKLCGNGYLDFQLAILIPMVQSVEDVTTQNRLWNSAFERFAIRHDLAAEVRLCQGRMWEAAGNLDRAGVCYEDIIKRYANAGHFVVDALAEAERLLRDNGRSDLVPLLYENAWSIIQKPSQMAAPFARQSNWSRVGERYAAILRSAGRAGDAAAVMRQLPKD